MAMDSIFKLAVVMDLVDRLTPELPGVADRVTKTTEKLNSAFGTMQTAGVAMAGLGTGIVGAGLATVTATFDTQDALGELASLGVEDLAAVEAAAKSFSDTWAGTTKADFITASYDIKSGIASLSDEGVAEFTKLAALTGKATKSTTEEMSSLFATGYGIYKGMYEDLTDMEFGEVFSAGIATAVKNYKTSGSEMAASISALGATATSNNVPLEEQLAILGQLQTTMSGSEAATKYRAFLNKAAEAGDKLGLSFMDANNQLLSMPEILTTLRSKYGDTIDAVEKTELKQAFGTDEAVAAIDLLYNNIGTLESGIGGLAESMGQGTAATEEMADAINQMPAQKFEVLKQKIHNNVEELGGALLPAVSDTMDSVSGVIDKTSAWISDNQELVSVIMNVGMRLGVILIVLGTLTGTIGTVGKAVLSARSAITTAKAGWEALNLAMGAMPLGWVVIGIAALVAGFILLWNTSESFRGFWIGLFEQLRGAVEDAWGTIRPALEELGGNLMELYEAARPILEIFGMIGGAILGVFLAQAVGAFRGALAALTPLTQALSSFVSFLTNMVKMFTALFKGDIPGALEFAKAGVEDLKNFFIHGFDAVLAYIGGFADGFLDVIEGLFSLAGIDVSFDGLREKIRGGLEGIRSVFGTVMGAAADTAKEKLDNIRNAYEQNGGGIRGVVAASWEGIKGYYTAGLTFIDNLTGGKLSGLADKFSEKLDAAHSAVAAGIERIKGAFNFSWKLPDLKLPHISVSGGEAPFGIGGKGSLPKFSVQWFAKGGIMTEPTIFGASGGTLMGGGEAGDEAILPLSALWEKMHSFIAAELSAKKEDALETLASKAGEASREGLKETGTKETGTVIQHLEVKVDLKDLKDLQLLKKIINELKDSQNSKDTAEPAPA